MVVQQTYPQDPPVLKILRRASSLRGLRGKMVHTKKRRWQNTRHSGAEVFLVRKGPLGSCLQFSHGSALLLPFLLFCGPAFALFCAHLRVSASDRV